MIFFPLPPHVLNINGQFDILNRMFIPCIINNVNKDDYESEKYPLETNVALAT